MNQLLTYSLLFFFAFALNSFSFSVSAASMAIVKNKDYSSFLLNDKTSDKLKSLPKKAKNNIPLKRNYYPIVFIKPNNFIKPALASAAKNKSTTSPSNPFFENNLYQQGKKFLVDYKDNEFLLNSLIIFSNTKQYLKETDLMLHNLSNNILRTLNLGSFAQNKQDAMFKKHNASLLAGERTSTSTFETQGKNANSPFAEEDVSLSTFLRKIFNFKNLFYILGITLIYSLLKALINFIFLRKKQKKQRRKQRHI